MMTIKIKMEFSCMGFFHAYSFEISLNFMCWALSQLSTAGPKQIVSDPEKLPSTKGRAI